MKVILLQDIKGLGKKFDVKQIKDGYARNFLFPKKLAKIAFGEEVKKLESQKAASEKQREEMEILLDELAKKLSGKEFHFYPEVGKKGEVYDSVKKENIKQALLRSISDLKIPEDEIEIILERPLRSLGEHEVKVKLGQKTGTTIKAIINKTAI